MEIGTSYDGSPVVGVFTGVPRGPASMRYLVATDMRETCTDAVFPGADGSGFDDPPRAPVGD